MRFRHCLLFYFTLFVSFLGAQTNVQGIVVDDQTGEPLPFVNIYASPSNEGAISNEEGYFEFVSTKKTRLLTFSYLGYENEEIDLAEVDPTFITVQMHESKIMIDEAIVVAKRNRQIPKDTAAISLQQLVVDNKENNRPKSYASYEYKEHSKIEYDLYKLGDKFTQRMLLQPVKVIFDYIDTTDIGYAYLPLLIQENISKHYYNGDPKKEKHLELAEYMTGVQNLSASSITDEIFAGFDLYDNTIIAGGKPFTSPFSATGLVTYRYFLTDSSTIDGSTFYRLDFSPKNKTSIAFTGYAWIEDKSYAIQSIEFKVPAKANLNFINDFYVKQGFNKPDGENWFLNEEEIHVAVNVRKNKDKGSLLIRKHMVRDSVFLNKPYDASVFKGEKLQVHDSARTYSREWWEANRIDSLSNAERGVVVMSDSLENTRIYKALSYMSYIGTTAFLKAGPVEFGRFYQFVSWNEIEGIRPKLAMRTNRDFNKNVQFWGSVAYGTKDKEWKYFASARGMLPRVNNKWHAMQVSYQKDFTFLGQDYDDQIFSHDNIFQSILRSEPLEKIMQIENFGLQYEREWVKGFATNMTVNRTNFYAVDNVFEFEKPTTGNQTAEIPRFGVMEFGVNAHLGIGESFFENDYYRFGLFSKKPIIDLSYKIGLKDFGDGDFGYQKLELDMYHRLSSKMGISKYNFKGGKVFGEAPYPLMFLPIGNQAFFRNSASYELMNEFEFAMDEYASFWLYHHFDGKIMNNLPLIKLLKFRSILIFKALAGRASEKNTNLILLPSEMSVLNGVYVETGFGFENIFKVARVDFLWRLTQRETPEVRKFGVRFSFDFGI